MKGEFCRESLQGCAGAVWHPNAPDVLQAIGARKENGEGLCQNTTRPKMQDPADIGIHEEI